MTNETRLIFAGLWLGLMQMAPAQTATVEFNAAGYAVGENAGAAVLQVLRRGDTSSFVTVELSTRNLTAAAGADYVAQSGLLLNFAPGQTNRPVSIPILDDGLVEGDETLRVILSNPVGAVLGPQSNAVLTIIDNETPTVLDGNFDPGAGANNDVFAMALQPGGKILIGGQFTTFNNTNCTRVARLNADGSLDLSFYPGTGANGDVYAVAVQADGKVLIGGAFTTVNGQASQYVARLNTNGAVDTSFSATNTVNNELRALAVQPDGKIILAGRFTSVAGQSRNAVARLNKDGSLDTTFNPGTGANGNVRSLTLQDDGLVLIGGQFTNYNGVARGHIARLQTNGALDLSFDPGRGADDQVRAIALATNGVIYIGGDFEIYNGTNRSAIARLFANGGLDLSFDQGNPNNDTVRWIAIQADGRVCMGGSFAEAGFAPRFNLARLLPDATADPTFLPGVGPNDEVFSVVIQPDGRALAAGKFVSVDGVARPKVARFLPDKNVSTFEFVSNNYFGNELAGPVLITVHRTGQTSNTGSVDFATTDGTAQAGSDYTTTNGTLAFWPLQTVATFTVPITNDGVAETNETVQLALSNPSNGVGLGPQATALLNIADNGGWFEIIPNVRTVAEQAGLAVVNIFLFGASGSPVSVDYQTSDGTATAGEDYVAQSGTLVFAGGTYLQQIFIPILNDSVMEGDETFMLALRNPGGGAVLGTQPSVLFTILDNEFGLGFSAPAYSVAENSPSVTITVNRNWDTTNTVTVDYSTSDGTATAGADYVLASGTLTFGPNDLSKTFTVQILSDALVEGNETINLTLTRATGGVPIGQGSAVLTIADNDEGIEFNEINVWVLESSNTVTLTVRRGDDGTNDLTVHYATTNGTATAGLDYTAQSGTLLLRPGETNATIVIPILGDRLAEPDETFSVALSAPGPGASLGARSVGQVRIIDDERVGSVDWSFNARPDEIDPFYSVSWRPPPQTALAAQPDGKIVMGGWDFLVRLTQTGVVETNFVPGMCIDVGGYYRPALQSDGRIVVGTVASNNCSPEQFVFRLLGTGQLDANFNTEARVGRTRAVTIQPDGQIIVAGNFDDFRPRPEVVNNAVLRLQTNGILDTNFNAGTFEPRGYYWNVPSTVEAIVLQPDGRIVVGGTFTNVAGVPRDRITRLNTDGSLDLSFKLIGGVRDDTTVVSALALQRDGKIVVGGSFLRLHDVPRNSLTRLNADGSVDPTFASPLDSNAQVNAIRLQPDGKVLAGGGGYGPSFVLRLNPDGSLDSTFDLGLPPDGPVNDLALLPNGDVIIAGEFTTLNGLPRALVARLRGDGLRFGPPQRSQSGVELPLFNAWPDRDVFLLGSSNLFNWQTVATNHPGSNMTSFFVPVVTASPQRFYRGMQAGP